MSLIVTGVMIDLQHLVLAAVCVVSVAFLSWFLGALLVYERPTRRNPVVLHLNKTAPLNAPTRLQRVHSNHPAARSRLDRRSARPDSVLQTGSNPRPTISSESDFGVLRLSDKKTKNAIKLRWLIMCVVLSATVRLSAQNASQPASPPAPSPLPTPAIAGPLQAAPPILIDAGSLGKLDLDGVVSGMGLWQGNHVAGDDSTQAALSNGQVFIQKTSGWWQFYVQAGAYNILELGTPFLPTDKTVSDLWGPVPVAYVKLVPGKTTSILVGALPALMGAEYTFDFQNMNIERGLLWNQENSVNRGIQLNHTMGKFAASISWNDGYYSNRYSWLSGSLTYTKGPHSLEFAGMGNLGQTVRQTLATPVQNNGSMYALIYTYTKGNWIVQPYYQYGSVPTNPKVGVVDGASTNGGAVLVSRTFKRGFSLAGRGEYIASTGSAAEQAVNLLYGPGSGAWSITLTPTYQYQRFFARGDLSFVRATDFTRGDVFGRTGTNPNQPRGVIEVGFLF